jgi:hypothetical protein
MSFFESWFTRIRSWFASGRKAIQIPVEEPSGETWPAIGQLNVPRICREISESIVELEDAFKQGKLTTQLTSGCEKVLGPELHSHYAKLVGKLPGPLQHLREEAVRSLLAQLETDLIPSQIAHAEPRYEADGSMRESGPFQIADANFDGVSTTTLRVDQMLDVRFWGIGFKFEKPEDGDFFDRRRVRTSARRLASDLRDLEKVLVRLRPETLGESFQILSGNERFERLILDILNEDAPHARLAPLIEDVLEKTDLRVQYPRLNRRQGARVQITSMIDPELHERKIGSIKRVEELVFLSPLSLAEFVISLHGKSAPATGGQYFKLSLLWACLGMKSLDAPRLASKLNHILFRALKETPESPLGPMVRVPLPVRQLIRHFVKWHAFESTNKLRARENCTGRQIIPASRRRSKSKAPATRHSPISD